MKFIPSFGEFATKGKQAFKRFPITLSWAIIGTLFTLFTVVNSTIDKTVVGKTIVGKTIVIFALGVSWLIATRFFEEQFKKDREWIFLITIGFLIFSYTTLPNKGTINDEQVVRLILYFISGHLLVFVAPFILQYNKNAYFNYLKSIFIAIVRSLFFSMILCLGIILALLAVEHLFNVDFHDGRYFQVFILCIGIVNTWIYLSDFPKEVHTQTKINYTKALEVLVKYILIPLVILYLIILYAYSLKILINWSLPKGWVSYLVIALAFLGFIIQLLIKPIQKTIDSAAIRKFYPWFYWLLLPLIVLLFVAIFRRISDYGITENRYFVLVIALWVLGMSAYMIISKKKSTKWFPLSLAVLALLISFGFWGAFSVSTNSQVNQFEKVFNDIKSTNFKTTFDKHDRFQSIIHYLGKKKQTDKLSAILGYNPEKVFKTDSYWTINNRLVDTLQISITNKTPNYKRDNYYYSLDDLNSMFDIKGYNTMSQVNVYQTSYYEKVDSLYNVSLRPNSYIIDVSKSDSLIETIHSDELIKNLLLQDKNHGLDKELMTIKKGNVKLVFQSLSVYTDKETKEKYLNSFNAYLFVKEN